ncbi:hypothetical protein [Aporhodopirellula aestuarii]|uniref:Uncharacterized protein n=1 Tax=Aporhodopirellula aestuarii TaxID=2950107 RepID=A0ABT0UD80_9BACT|nr:hypothetical protein [Aporhodopirellula aestuarii]MCM2374246.1 hypothetical protein [Aporhodopirellula aestuarii]
MPASPTRNVARRLRGLPTVIGTMAICVTAVSFVGCGKETAGTSDSAVTAGAISSDLVLKQKPESVLSLTDAAEKLVGPEDAPNEPNASQEVVLIGRIDAGDFPAFQEGQATFMLSELPADGHGVDDPDHEDNCPFCKRRAEKAPKAIVNLVGQDGMTLTTDARKLIGVAEGDRVIVVGTGSYDESVNAITLNSSGVYTGPW